MGKLDLFVLGAFIKVLLIPSYRSTDFDVHRNWLAITQSLPLSKWYFEHTSQWTLDYPPFFAYFEYFLSWFVPESAVADGCLALVAEDRLYGPNTVYFQRATVLVSELALALALLIVKSDALFALCWMCPVWFVLDHIHFQYNAFLTGIYLTSLYLISRKRYLTGALAFSTTLCFKHIYLYVAPAYFSTLLVHYVQPLKSGWFRRLVKLGSVTLIPFVIAFSPFLVVGGLEQLLQIKKRLFPFARGLTHAYWAPNVWAVYTFVDRVLGIWFKNTVASATRGVVGQIAFSNLYEVKAWQTFLLTAVLQVLVCLKFNKSNDFLTSAGLCGLASFLFGYHVHEKAVLVPLVPLFLVALESQQRMRELLPLLTSACFTQLPLLYEPAECVFKYVYTVTYLLAVHVLLPKKLHFKSAGTLAWAYFYGYLGVVVLAELVPLLIPKFEYAGLMLISLYGFAGVGFSTLRYITGF